MDRAEDVPQLWTKILVPVGHFVEVIELYNEPESLPLHEWNSSIHSVFPLTLS